MQRRFEQRRFELQITIPRGLCSISPRQLEGWEMRNAAMIFGAILGIAAPTFVEAGPKEEATAALDQWVAALNSNDVERIVATYLPDATVHGTVSPSLATGADALRAYFTPATKTKVQVKMGDSSATALSDDAVVLAGFYEFSGTAPSGPYTIPARYSFVVAKRDGQWGIIHHHSSQRPKPPQ
jgi:uncharacterized protein (TIGR02246 family)